MTRTITNLRRRAKTRIAKLDRHSHALAMLLNDLWLIKHGAAQHESMAYRMHEHLRLADAELGGAA